MGNKGAANRCKWVNLKNPAYIRYHDTEWGVPQHKDEVLFEMLFLEWFQAGLSWECILNKREGFRRAFDGFDAEKISRYEDGELARLLADPGIVRNRLKIRASIGNSRVFLKIQQEYGTFDAYIWGFTAGKTIDPAGCPRPAAIKISFLLQSNKKQPAPVFGLCGRSKQRQCRRFYVQPGRSGF